MPVSIRLLIISLAISGLLSLATAAQEPASKPNPPAPAATSEASTGDADAAPGQSEPPLPDLAIPDNADTVVLQQVLQRARSIPPEQITSPERYKIIQTAIRDASRLLLQNLKDDSASPQFKRAELDMISSSVALMTYFSEKQQTEVIKQLQDFLKSRPSLSIQDVQTGMLAAAMLELQPNKKPARDIYELMDELLKPDEREEMQSLRLNLQASMRRLKLLGSKFEFKATSVDGKTVNVDDYAGKFVIVDFFATWCEPCLSEIPRIKKYHSKYESKGLAVVGISLDGDAQDLQNYLGQAELPWLVVHDNAKDPLERYQMKFGVAALPMVLLLNKEGTVVSLEARGAELDRLMQMLFERPTLAPPQAEAPPAKDAK